MNLKTTLHLIIAPALIAGLAACSRAPEGPYGAPEGATLATTQIPEGFDFATTRSVALVVTRSDIQTLEVARPDGAQLYRGPAVSRLTLNLPTKDTALRVTTTSFTGEQAQANLPVVEGLARL